VYERHDEQGKEQGTWGQDEERKSIKSKGKQQIKRRLTDTVTRIKNGDRWKDTVEAQRERKINTGGYELRRRQREVERKTEGPWPLAQYDRTQKRTGNIS
jgi:hypothetical protein